MMEKLRNPKNVKTISLIVAAIFVIGCFTLAMSAGGFGSGVASAASSESAIGVVNYQVLVSQSPRLEGVREDMQKAIADTRRDFDSKSANMNDEEKERYYKQLQEHLGNKEKELMDPLLEEINATIKKVADKKGLKVVVDKSTVVYGGTDITDEVAKALQTAAKNAAKK
ncbi:MAG: OmpH family outer membrane protein [Acidaminococcaceae bacterium]|nr:OmpH family outer membrane protein [Acidaminococcaceae bacterium]